MSGPLDIARHHLTDALTREPPAPIAASDVWNDNLDRNHRPVIRDSKCAEDVIELVTTKRGYFTLPCTKDDPHFQLVVNEALAWHVTSNMPLESLPLAVQETKLAPDRVRFEAAGRSLSTAFLWFLRCALRVTNVVRDVRVVAEIGSGFGGLARIFHLLDPKTQYVLIDMPECLWFAEVYLNATLPDARIYYLSSGDTVADIPRDAAFVMIPNSRINDVISLNVDCVINSQSLSEMTTAAADYYIDWVQRLEPRYFYNVNRFGQHSDGLAIQGRIHPWCGDDISANPFAYDPHWDVAHWGMTHDEGAVGLADPRYPTTLELLVRRVEKNERNAETYAEIARSAEADARSRLRADSKFFRQMWTATTKAPTQENLKFFASVLRTKGWREANYYSRRYSELGGEELPQVSAAYPPAEAFLHF